MIGFLTKTKAIYSILDAVNNLHRLDISYWKALVSNGIPGVETRLPILFSEGVKKGRITLNDFVALTATNHAKTYGLYPRKGTIAIGSDADLVLWHPERRVTITHAMLQDGSDYTPYEGMEVTGWPVRTILRGRTIALDGQFVGTPGYGVHLPRAKPGPVGVRA